MERDKENFDGWMIDYMAGRLSEEDLQQFHALLNSDVFYKKRFKELSKEYAKYLIPHFAEEEANNYEKLLHRLDLKKRSHSLASSRYFSWRNMRRIAATVALLITSSIACYYELSSGYGIMSDGSTIGFSNKGCVAGWFSSMFEFRFCIKV